jgi:hypothetical protein
VFLSFVLVTYKTISVIFNRQQFKLRCNFNYASFIYRIQFHCTFDYAAAGCFIAGAATVPAAD